jgi:hypothetical protein
LVRIGVASVLIMAVGSFSSSSTARSMAAGEISGSSPCTLTSTSTSGILPAISATRSVPLGQSGLVSSTRPPKERTSAAISSQSAATQMPPGRFARDADSYVCCKTDLPVSLSSSFRGSRVEASRAGMIMVLFMPV